MPRKVLNKFISSLTCIFIQVSFTGRFKSRITQNSLFQTLSAKKEEFVEFCMMAKAGIGRDFKAKIKTGSYSQRSFPSPRLNSFLGRLLEETTSRTATGPHSGCINQEWQFDFVCPVFLNSFHQAYSKFFIF